MNVTYTISGLVELVVLIFQVVVLVKAIGYPAWAWREAGVSRGLWLLLLVLAIFLSVCGFILTLYFVFSGSVRIKRVMQLGRRPGFPGA